MSKSTTQWQGRQIMLILAFIGLLVAGCDDKTRDPKILPISPTEMFVPVGSSYDVVFQIQGGYDDQKVDVQIWGGETGCRIGSTRPKQRIDETFNMTLQTYPRPFVVRLEGQNEDCMESSIVVFVHDRNERQRTAAERFDVVDVYEKRKNIWTHTFVGE